MCNMLALKRLPYFGQDRILPGSTIPPRSINPANPGNPDIPGDICLII